MLTRIRAHYNSGHDGLELVWFLDTERATLNYMAMLGEAGNPKIRADFEEKLDKLAAALDRYLAKPTTDNALVITESLRWLEGARQVPELIHGG